MDYIENRKGSGPPWTVSLDVRLPLAGFIKLIIYLKICHWILNQVFHRTGILFFVLVSMYGCSGVTYMSMSMELHLCSSNSYLFIRVYDVLEESSRFKSLTDTFVRNTKTSVNTCPRYVKRYVDKLITYVHNFTEINSCWFHQ